MICFVASSVVAAVFFGLNPTEKVTLIRLVAFEETIEKVRSYSIEVLVREPVKHLDLEFSYLVRVDEKTHEELKSLLDSKGILEPSEEALLENPKVEKILAMMEPFPEHPDYRFFRDVVEYEARYRKENVMVHREAKYEVGVLDIHRFFRHLSGDAAPDVFRSYILFAALFHEENVSFYEGVQDYYLNRFESMGELSYEREGESYLFENPNVIIPRGSEYVDVAEAPPFGTISLEDLKEQETVRFVFTTRHLAGPAVLLARIFVDGEEEEYYYKIMGWPEEEY